MKITYWNPENLLVELSLLEPGKWLAKLDVDLPACCEFVADMSLSWLCPSLPNDFIVDVEFEVYAVDPSGYEYFGWIIYTR